VARHWDVVVIGGGHNGLVAGAYLARRGLATLILEGRETLGGAAVTREFHPGFSVDAGPHSVGWVHPDVLTDLDLAAHGLTWMPAPDPPVTALAGDGDLVPLWADPAAAGAELERHGDGDAERWQRFVAWVDTMAAVVRRLRDTPMPDLPDPAIADVPSLVGLGLGWRGLGKHDMGELLRVLPMPVAHVAEDWLTGDAAKGVVAAGVLVGIDQGPMAQGTALPLFLNHGGPEAWRPVAFPVGGLRGLVDALASAARAAGAEVRMGAGVERVLVEAGRATGVVLADGEEIRASRVVSNADPRTTMLDLVGPALLDPDVVRSFAHVRCRGVAAKVHLALERQPLAASERCSGLVVDAPSVASLERAHDAAKYGGVADRPLVELTIPSLRAGTYAPEGKHVVSALVQWTPYALRDAAWGDDARDRLAASVVEVVERLAPGAADAVVATEVLAPPDLEREFGLPHGDLYHGQPALDQMFFMRPVGGWARHRSPVPGLYFCSAGTHPGGGVTGAPGRLASRAVLADVGHGR
jgi:phytoene dehydrogenase-like protein